MLAHGVVAQRESSRLRRNGCWFNSSPRTQNWLESAMDKSQCVTFWSATLRRDSIIGIGKQSSGGQLAGKQIVIYTAGGPIVVHQSANNETQEKAYQKAMSQWMAPDPVQVDP